MVCVVVPAVLAVTVATVVHAVPFVLTWRVKSRVFQAAFSPPAWACLTTSLLTDWLLPRSTCIHFVAPSEHHLSVLPPLTLPLTALAGLSSAAQEESAVAGLPSARLVSATPPTRLLSVYHASVLHSDCPDSEVNGRGERT